MLGVPSIGCPNAHATSLANETHTPGTADPVQSTTMECPGCGVEVSDEQRFCNRCGTALATTAATGETTDWAAPTAASVPMPVPDDLSEPPTEPPTEPTTEQLDTVPIDVVQPPTEQLDTVPTEVVATDDDRVTQPIDQVVTTPLAATAAAATHDASATPTEPVPVGVTTTAEMPVVFDGVGDLTDYPTPREPFRFRLVFLLSLFSLVAALMAFVADVIDLRTSRPTAGIDTGASTLDDLGSNLAMAGFVGAATMVLGGLLACFGIRWGAGLAGGAALAVVGWSGLTIGLAEFPIAVAESITRTSTESFTLTVTRDIGWLLIAGIGVLAVFVFVASLRSSGTGGQRALNPWIAAVAAVTGVVLAFGPLVPVGAAVFADNFRSTDPNRDLPTAFFAGRLGQVALIAAAVVAGTLIVRAYGLGLATGAISVASWMWITSLGELGSRPIGIADRNPGAADTVPHAVTSVGLVTTLTLLLAASVTAIWQRRRAARVHRT